MSEPEIVTNGERLKALIERALPFFLRMQLPKGSMGLLLIHVTVIPMCGGHGMCANVTDSDEELATEFEIDLNGDLSDDDILRALAHESVHVAQYFQGRLKDTGNMFTASWLGKVYDIRSRPHDELPWEREALHLEWTLINAFRLQEVKALVA